VKKCEYILPRLVNNDRLEAVNHVDSGLKKLLAGRCDIYVDGESNLLGFLNSDKFKNSGIRIAGVMETITSHAFLHKKHTDIVSELSYVLKQMKEKGLFEKHKGRT
jgi:ABC-type amino acid transport substrate-binding protein